MKARENPFSTDRLHALRYRFRGVGVGAVCVGASGSEPIDDGWTDVLARLEALRYRAAIVGACGTGKTTLILELADRLSDAGRRVTSIRIGQDDPHLPPGALEEVRALGPHDVVLFDGADHLSRWSWWRLRRAARGTGGLIITMHRPGRLPTLLHTRTDAALLEELIDELTCGLAGPALPPAGELFERHGGNVREAFREMYDLCAEAG